MRNIMKTTKYEIRKSLEEIPGIFLYMKNKSENFSHICSKRISKGEVRLRKNFIKNLKELRKEHNLTQEDLGNILGVTRIMVSYYEIGRSVPSFQVLEKIIKCFKINPDQILGTYMEIKEEKDE